MATRIYNKADYPRAEVKATIKRAMRKTFPRTREEMLSHFGIKLSDEQLKKYAAQHPVTRRDLKDDICDSIDRDSLIDAVVVHVLGEAYHWPLNMDDADYTTEFYPKFFIAADNLGIKVVPKVLKHYAAKAKNNSIQIEGCSGIM